MKAIIVTYNDDGLLVQPIVKTEACYCRNSKPQIVEVEIPRLKPVPRGCFRSIHLPAEDLRKDLKRIKRDAWAEKVPESEFKLVHKKKRRRS